MIRKSPPPPPPPPPRDNAQQTFTYTKSSIETLEKGVKYVQN